MNLPSLETERLLLKPLSLEHLSMTYVNWMNDPEVYMYLESGGDYSMKDLELYLNEQVKREILFWAIHLKISGKHIGNIKIDPINAETKSGEYGIMIGDKTEWGNGYAKEATIAVIDYCFKKMGLLQITLGVIDKNIGALNLYKNIGFTVDKILKEAGVYDNELCDTIRMIKKNDK